MFNRFIYRLKIYLSKVKRNLYTREEIIVFYRSAQEKDKDESWNNLEIRKVTFNNVYDALTFQDINKINYFKNLINLGDIGFYSYKDGICINRNWVRLEGIYNISHFVQKTLPKGYVYIHACETDINFRNKGIQTKVLKYIVNEFYNKNILVSVNKHNISSVITFRKNNFKVGVIYNITVILGFKFISKEVYNE